MREVVIALLKANPEGLTAWELTDALGRNEISFRFMFGEMSPADGIYRTADNRYHIGGASR